MKSNFEKEIDFNEKELEKELVNLLEQAAKKVNYCKQLVSSGLLPFLKSDLGIDELLEAMSHMRTLSVIKKVKHEQVIKRKFSRKKVKK